ncbi:MAG: ribosome silencing factor [Clostridia bacterium]|nr:ribosome silencing factor [Clostridia bacterium]
MKHEEMIKNIVKILDDKKAEDIKAIEIRELTIVADCFIIASGTSSTHVKALAGEVEDAMDKMGVKPNHIEGRATGWIVLDYDTIIVHIFQRESREYYNLERLWQDADYLDIDKILAE